MRLVQVVAIALLVGVALLWPIPNVSAWNLVSMYAYVDSPANGATVSGEITCSGHSYFELTGGTGESVVLEHWQKVTRLSDYTVMLETSGAAKYTTLNWTTSGTKTHTYLFIRWPDTDEWDEGQYKSKQFADCEEEKREMHEHTWTVDR